MKQCFGYAGLEEVGGENLVLVAWEVSLFVFFNFRMSLNFRVDISLLDGPPGIRLRKLSFVKAEGSDALLNLSQYKLDFTKLRESASYFPGF